MIYRVEFTKDQEVAGVLYKSNAFGDFGIEMANDLVYNVKCAKFVGEQPPVQPDTKRKTASSS